MSWFDIKTHFHQYQETDLGRAKFFQVRFFHTPNIWHMFLFFLLSLGYSVAAQARKLKHEKKMLTQFGFDMMQKFDQYYDCQLKTLQPKSCL